MITVAEIFRKSDKLFFKVASAALKEENVFPLVIPSNKIIVNTSFSKLQEAIVPIYKDSKDMKGRGYSVEWRLKNIEGTKHKIPARIYYETLEDYLFFTKRALDFLRLKDAFKLIEDAFPDNSAWIKDYPEFLLTNAAIMEDLLRVVSYFYVHTPPHNLYLRELPIAVHSKFVECNAKPLKKLLDMILPAENVNLKEKDFLDRYKIKRPNIYTRIRVLDEVFKSTLKFDELALTLEDISQLDWQPEKVFIIENSACFFSFPYVKNSVAIFGEGFKSRLSKHIPWLASSELYCWFDMDAAGFEMLNMIRQYYNHAVSFMMDEESYNEFSEFSVESVYRRIDLPLLQIGERKMYQFLQQNNRRLEQERISNAYIRKKLKLLNLIAP